MTGIEKLKSEYQSNKGEEIVIMPYEQFNLTQPQDASEVALSIKDAIAVITMKKDENNEIKNYLIELYSKNAIKIGESENGNQFKADIDIITSLIEAQQKKLDEIGGNFTVAGANSLDNQGRIESFLELYNREIITMNEAQKEKYDRFKADYERGINDIARDNVEGKRDEKDKLDKNVENLDVVKNQENAEMVRSMAEQDLGIEVDKIVPIEDNLFYENNPQVAQGKSFFVMDKKGNPQVVNYNDGKFETSEGFKEAENRTSRVNVMTNDDNNIEEKIAYGYIESQNGSNYAFTYGSYGTPELVEIRTSRGGGLSYEKQLGRKIQTPNTKQYEINREGDTRDNITRRMFKTNGYTADGTRMEIDDKMERINQDRRTDGSAEDIKPEDLAENISQRVDVAYNNIEEKLKSEGFEPNTEEERQIKDDLQSKMEKDNIVFDEEGVESYCEEYINKKEQEKQKEQEKEEDEDFEPTLYNTHKRPWM